MTSEQKISRMYRRFGESQSGKKCKDCTNLIRVERGNHRVSKCLVYGDTFSDMNRGSNLRTIGRLCQKFNYYIGRNSYKE